MRGNPLLGKDEKMADNPVVYDTDKEPATTHDVAEGGVIGALGGAAVGALAGGAP